MSINVPRLGLASHPSLQSSHDQGGGVGTHHDNTSIDDLQAHLHHSHNSNNLVMVASASFSSSSNNLNNNNNNNNNNLDMFTNDSSNGKPGSVSPRPSRGVNNSAASTLSRQNSSTNGGGGLQRAPSVTNNANSAAHYSSLRRSPSMPSTATADINSNFYPLQSQYSFELRKNLKSIREMHRIHPQPYFLGSGGGELSERGSGNSSIPITAIAASSRGTNLAWGDSSGRVYFLEREARSGDGDEGEDGEDAADTSRNTSRRQVQRMPSLQSFSPVHGATCYNPYVDPLSSNDVRPAVTALSFLPEISPATLLLTANEKTPKLWRLVKVSSLASPIRAVDMIGTRQVGPLTVPEQPTSVLKEVRKFNVDHEYNINSMCVIRDGTQFITADEVTIRLWNVEYEHRGLLVSSENGLNSSNSSAGGDDGSGQQQKTGGDTNEVINLVHAAPHAPHTLLVGLSGGQVRISDLRCNLKLKNANNGDGSSVSVAAYPPGRRCDGLYRAVASATLGCDLSLCGNYIAHRDVSCLHLFDIRKASSSIQQQQQQQQSPSCLVNRWILQDHVAKNFGQLYQLGSLFEKVSVKFVGSRIVTGGFGECLITVNAMDPSSENVDVRRLLCETDPANVEVADYTGEMTLTTSDDDVANIYRDARLARRKKRRGGSSSGGGNNNKNPRARENFDAPSASDGDDDQHGMLPNDGTDSDDNGRRESTRFTFLSTNIASLNSPSSSPSSSSSVLRALDADQAAEEHFQHYHLHNQEGRAEWKRVTKLCVLPSPSWIGIQQNNNNNEQDKSRRDLGEVLATCGDRVHHVAVSLN